MKNKVIKLTFSAIIILYMLALSSCEKENEQQLQPKSKVTTESLSLSVDIAKQWYNKKNQNNQIYLQNSEGILRSANKREIYSFPQPNWNRSTTEKSGHITAVDVDLHEAEAISFVSEQNYHAFQETKEKKYTHSLSRLVILKSSVIKNVTLGCIMTVIPSKEYIASHENSLNEITYLKRGRNFDGMILFHRLNGKYANGWVYENGKITKIIADKPSNKKMETPININILKQNKNLTFKTFVEQESLQLYSIGDSATVDEPIDGGTFPDVIINGNYTPYPDYYIGIILNDLQNWSYYDPDPNPWNPDYGGGGGGNGGYIPSTDEVIADKSLAEYGLDDIFNCLIQKAKSPFVKNLLNRFYGSDAEFDVTYMVGQMPTSYENSNGLCDFSFSFDSIQGNEYKKGIVILNKTRIDEHSSLEIVRTMLHETMHAYIHSYLYTSNRTLKTTTLDKDFNEYSWLVQGGSQDVEHNFMAQNWVTTLTQELMKLHQTQDNYERVWTELIARGLNGNNRVTFYESLAWKGLEGTNAYKSLTPEKKDSLDKYYREKNVLPISKKWKCEE